MKAHHLENGRELLEEFRFVGLLRFGECEAPVNRILYLALEDPARRFKARLLDMMTCAVESGRFVVYVAPGLSLSDPSCFEFLEKMIRESGFELVVIDTFQAATMGINSFDDEKLSVIIRHLFGITRKLGTTIVVNDHFRKTQNHKSRKDLDLNDVKGSGGKLQNADVFILMDRQNGQLRISGRSKEWDKAIGLLVNIAPQGSQGMEKFTYAGDLAEFGSKSREKGQQSKESVPQAVANAPSLISSTEVSGIVKLSEPTTRRYLKTLISEGRVAEEGAGRWKRYRPIDQSQEEAK